MRNQSISARIFDLLDRVGKLGGGWDGDRLSRARVQVGIISMTFVLLVPMTVTAICVGAPGPALVMLAAVLVAQVVALVLLRREQLAGCAAILCVTFNATGVFSSLHQDGLPLLLHPIMLATPALAIYLLGARRGLLFTGLVIIEMVGGYLLHSTGNTFKSNFLPGNGGPIVALVAVEAALVVGGLGWLHSKAHERAHLALAGAVGTLRQSEANLISLIDSTNDMVALFDLQMRFVHFNAALGKFAEQRLGIPLAAGASLFSRTSPVHEAVLKLRIDAALERGRIGWEDVIETPSGRVFLDLAMSSVIGADGKPRGLTLFVRDVTARRAAELRLVETEAQLRQVQKLQAVGTLSAGIAHEINNPLASVVSNLESINEELIRWSGSAPKALLAELFEFHLDAAKGAERIKRIVNDVDAFSRTREAALTPIDVTQPVREALKIATRSVLEKGVVLLDLAAVSPVLANEKSLIEVVVNLIENAAYALRAGVAGNHVKVATRTATDGRVSIEVQDNGEGMSPAVLDRIFEPFFTTRPVGKGTGMGLSICHGIVSRLGGQIEVESAPGKGTTVRLLLQPWVAPTVSARS